MLDIYDKCGKPPGMRDPDKYGKDSFDRLDQMGEITKKGHKKHASMPHWYL